MDIYYYLGIIPAIWWSYYATNFEKLKNIAENYNDMSIEQKDSIKGDLLMTGVLLILSLLWYAAGFLTSQWYLYLFAVPFILIETIVIKIRRKKGKELNEIHALISAFIKMAYTVFLIQNGINHFI